MYLALIPLSAIAFPIHGDVPDAAQRFREFLSDPPWIKKLVYGELGSTHEHAETRQGKKKVVKKPDGFVLYETALQSNSFYFKYVSNSVSFNDRGIGNGYVAGRASNMFWSLTADQAKVNYSLLEAAEPNLPSLNSIERVVREFEGRVKRVLSLGIIHLKFGTLQWIDRSSFTAESEWGFGKIEGRIVEYDDGRPSKLTYSIEKKPQLLCSAYYSYNNADFPPNKIVRSVSERGVERFVDTNIISELEIGGSFEKEAAVYTPSYFRTSNNPSQVVYQSNGLSYFLRSDGKFDLLSEDRTVLSDLGIATYPRSNSMLLLLLATTSITLICWIVARRARVSKN